MPEDRILPSSRRAFLGAGAGLALTVAGCGGSSSKLPPSESTQAADTGAPPATSAAAGTDVEGPETSVAESAEATTEAAPGEAVPGPPAAGGTSGGRIAVGFVNAGNSWDPALGYSETGWDSICNLTFAPLYSYSQEQAPLPHCAADMPEVSSDGRVYTIPLRDGVTFHNGRPVTAADYKYALERTLDPKLESWAASYLYTIDGAEALYGGKAKELAGVRVVDDATLEVTLVQSDVTFLYALTQPFTAPVPREEVERLGDDWGTAAIVGNGPFRMVGHDATAQRASFERHQGYHWPGLPYVDEVEFQWGLDASVQLLKLQRGEVDVLYSGFTPVQVQRVAASEQLQPFLFQAPLFANRWVNLNPRVEAFKDARVRAALNWATDRSQLERITGAEAAAWGAPYPRAFAEQQRTFQPYGYDPERAKALLAEAGSPQIRAKLTITDSPEPELGQVLQQQWKAVGIEVELDQIGLDASYELALEGKLDLWFSGYYAVYPTAIDLVSQYYETGGSANYTKYTNAEVDRLMAEARGTVEDAARETLLAQVEQLIGDDAVHVFLQNLNWLMGVNQERLQNFHYSGVYGAYYDRLWVSA